MNVACADTIDFAYGSTDGIATCVDGNMSSRPRNAYTITLSYAQRALDIPPYNDDLLFRTISTSKYFYTCWRRYIAGIARPFL